MNGGGCWLDATMYMTNPFPEEILEYSLYTIRHGIDSPLCNGLWTSFFWVGERHNAFFKWVRDFFLVYWKNENAQIDYFLVDDIIMLGYRNILEIRQQIDAIPINNTKVFMLGNTDDKKRKILSDDTYLFKLSWKKHNRKI